MSEFGAITALVGKNSSGKSNVLRALNLFFNGEIEPGRSLNFARDHHLQVPRTRKKKRIRIRVDFTVPTAFRYRRELSHLTALGTEFAITRTWSLDERRMVSDSFAIDAGAPVTNEDEVARQFLSLIAYRYIPNRSIPAELLRDESQAIADAIFMRMKGDTHAAALLSSLTKAASRMLRSASDSLRASGSPIVNPEVATPGSLGEMLRMSGFQAVGPHGAVVQDEDWGAGHQAFFLYLLLHELDTTYSRFFGWRQATVWGVEEPESALHRDLETRLADRLRKWSSDDQARLQILHTTHSPIFVMASETGYWVEVADKETALSVTPIPELVRSAEVRGVSGWVHPVLSFPWNPIVLVEGPGDVEALAHVASLVGLTELRFLSLPQLDPSERAGGKDPFVGYLRKNQKLIHNRPRESPLLVLLDWDVSEQDLRQIRDAYGVGGDQRVLRMDPALADPLLGADFRGIERFYPAALIRDAEQAGEILVATRPGRPYSVSKAQLAGAKHHLLGRLRATTDTTALNALAQVLAHVATQARGTAAIQLRLPQSS